MPLVARTQIDLRRERVDQGWSVKGLADHLNVSPSVIEGADAGNKPRLAGHAFKIASFFGHRVTDVWPLEDEIAIERGRHRRPADQPAESEQAA